MIVHDEYKCRRCPATFHVPVVLDDADTLLSYVDDQLTSRQPQPRIHTCEFGGVGIGDWVGASEAKP